MWDVGMVCNTSISFPNLVLKIDSFTPSFEESLPSSPNLNFKQPPSLLLLVGLYPPVTRSLHATVSPIRDVCLFKNVKRVLLSF